MTHVLEWTDWIKTFMPDFHPEIVSEPYPHVVLIENLSLAGTYDETPLEEWLATCDTYGDVMHLALRSGSYVIEEVGDRRPSQVALWFDEKFSSLYNEELSLLVKELIERYAK